MKLSRSKRHHLMTLALMVYETHCASGHGFEWLDVHSDTQHVIKARSPRELDVYRVLTPEGKSLTVGVKDAWAVILKGLCYDAIR